MNPIQFQGSEHFLSPDSSVTEHNANSDEEITTNRPSKAQKIKDNDPDEFDFLTQLTLRRSKRMERNPLQSSQYKILVTRLAQQEILRAEECVQLRFRCSNSSFLVSVLGCHRYHAVTRRLLYPRCVISLKSLHEFNRLTQAMQTKSDDEENAFSIRIGNLWT